MNKKKNLFLLFVLISAMVLVYNYSTHPIVLKSLFPEKIWAHRVNSTVKLKEVSNEFTGVELDVVWDETEFDVNHPPATSINLSLEEYFLGAPKKEKIGLWLDFKNLDSINSQKALKQLDSLARAFSIVHQNVIIESRKPKNLKFFQEKGFLTSYYLPSGLSSNGDTKIQLVKHIKKRLENNPADFISSSLGDYVYIKDIFPEEKKLLWHLGGFDTLKNKIRIYMALIDNKVEVILLPYKSETGDR